MPKKQIAIKEMHRTVGDLSKPAANIPTGTWKLRAIKLSSKDVTFQPKDGEEYDTVEYTLSMEPITPTASVDPTALAEVDERTGKPVYEGKRLFLRYKANFRSDMVQLGAALAAMGFGADDSFEDIVERNSVKGRFAQGDIFNRTYKRNDGSDGTEQKVRSWAVPGAAAGFAL